MKWIGNILWIILGGFILFLEYLAGTIFLFLTIVGIPFAFQTFKLATLSLLPFGKQVVSTKRSGGCLEVILNVVWLLVFGIAIALTHLFFALIFAITVIGIPFAQQHIKLAGLGLTPFGKEIRED